MPARRRRARTALAVAGVVIAAVVLGAVAASPGAITPIPPGPLAFDPALIRRGAEAAALGDCTTCHTANPERPFAGGVPVATPFGTIYATNITPDRDTGIGTWSAAAFRRAMRLGIDRAGRHLYPAFPYDHFTHATDDDLQALYAFLMTRAPVHAAAPRTRLRFPFNHRILLAGWNWLFLRAGPVPADSSESAEWNRGAYLVQALGHCGACHTPRNAFGAERSGRALDGGEAEGWYAPPLDTHSPAAIRWSADELAVYLRGGVAPDHGTPAGPMRAVAQNVARLSDQDVQAIAAYLHGSMHAGRAPVAVDRGVATASMPGAAIFAGACAACHAANAPMTRAGDPAISEPSPVHERTPRNVIRIVLDGLPWREGGPQPYMPGFDAALTDRQVADLLAYLRARFTDQPPWPHLDDDIRRMRRHGDGS
jgi:mono/diheme cytochrome c family protein